MKALLDAIVQTAGAPTLTITHSGYSVAIAGSILRR